MECEKLIELLEDEFGWLLLKYWTHLKYHDECKIDKNDDISPDYSLHNRGDKYRISEELYSGCWYGGFFFEDLFTSKYGIKGGENYTVTHGYLENSEEIHYFCIIKSKDKYYILNSYGGIPWLTITSFTYKEYNKLYKEMNEFNLNSYKTFFGISNTNYDSYDSINIILTPTENFNITKYGIRLFVEEIKLHLSKENRDYFTDQCMFKLADIECI